MLLARQRELVARFAARLRPDGLAVGTAGNISLRAGEFIAITPSGVAYDALEASRVPVVTLAGDPADANARSRPSTELPMHLAVYRSTAARGVVHTHSPYATALSTVVEALPAVHYLIAELGGAVPVLPYETPGSDELASAAAAALTSRAAVLLGNHGALTVGDSLERAYERAVTLEWLAAVYYRARLLGEPTLLEERETERLVELVERYHRPR